MRLAPAAVDCTPLTEFLPKHPQAKDVLLNALSCICEDLAERALKTMPLEKLLFGSYAPYYV